MAKQYFALNQIKHGNPDGSLTVFEVDEQVTGLSKDEMVALWEAGVLREHDPSKVKKDDRDDKIAALEAELAELRASQSADALVEPASEENVPPEGSINDGTSPDA